MMNDGSDASDDSDASFGDLCHIFYVPASSITVYAYMVCDSVRSEILRIALIALHIRGAYQSSPS